ncbi:hypothetical protein L7F22_019301 [Adiantum nelumboides]|nr:hypothetical protein [Adiantum nelumboides]
MHLKTKFFESLRISFAPAHHAKKRSFVKMTPGHGHVNGTGSGSSSHKKHTLETLRPILIKLTLSCSVPIPAHASQDGSGSPDLATNASTSENFNVPDIPTPSVKPRGPPLNSEELTILFDHLADAEFTANTSHHAQIGACLTSLRMSGWDMSSQALTIASGLFLKKALPVHVPQTLSKEEIKNQHADDEWSKVFPIEGDEGYQGSLDLVGTGGDGHDTYNVSTTAAIVAAGVPGVRVCKHGARASSSSSGSADLLAALGVPLANLTPSTMPRLLPNSSFTFLFAQLFHPSMAPLAPIRRSLGFPTIFNVLGPLVNPARPKRSVMGVHSWGLGQTFAEALRESNCERGWIVCGREGLDEISPEGETDVWELRDGVIKHLVISPASFGLPAHPLAHVKSGTAAENACVARYLFEPKTHSGPIPKGPLSEAFTFTSSLDSKEYSIPAGTHLDALLDYVLLQTAALLYVAGKGATLSHSVILARSSLAFGGAIKALDQLSTEAKRAGQAVESEQHEREERELRRIYRKDDFYYSKDLRNRGGDPADTTDVEGR